MLPQNGDFILKPHYMCHGKWQILTQPWVTHRITGEAKFKEQSSQTSWHSVKTRCTEHVTCLEVRALWAATGSVSIPGNTSLPRKPGGYLHCQPCSLSGPSVSGNKQETGVPFFTIVGAHDRGRMPEVYEDNIHRGPPHLQPRAGTERGSNCKANRPFSLFSSLSAPSPSSSTRLPAPSPELSLHLGSRNQRLTVGFYTLYFLVPRKQSEHVCYTFVKTHKMYNTKSEPDANHGLWVLMTCQCGSIDYNKWSTGATNPSSGGHCMCVSGAGSSLYFLLSFILGKPKTALKT